ncbi:hypothetical protein [Erwinia sp. E_sp_B04_7]|uniref:hypothetical protein n=1 Tax=unclassified Erwinia TaxID=2622719 RepID=UPI0030D1DF7E
MSRGYKYHLSSLTGASLAVDRVLTEQIVNDEHKLVTRAELDKILYKFRNGDYEEATRIPKIAPIVRRLAGQAVNGKEQAFPARSGFDFYTN